MAMTKSHKSKNTRAPFWEIALALLVLTCLGGLGCTPTQKRVRRLSVGAPTPFYSIKLPQLNTVDFPFSALRGKVVLVDFFTSFCQPCLQIIPKLKTLYDENRHKGFLVVGVALERQLNILKPYVSYMQIDYPVLVANAAIYRGSTVFGRVLRVPSSAIVDRCGKIRRVIIGVPKMNVIQNTVQKLLEEKTSSCQRK